MAAEKDVSGDAKKTVMVIGGLAITLLVGGYLAISWLNKPPPSPSRISVNRAAGGTGSEAPESLQYRQLLKESNEEGARQALETNASFIASVSMAPQPEPLEIATVPVPEPTPVQHIQQVQYVSAPGLAADQKKAVESYLSELIAQRAPSTGKSAGIAGGAVVQGAGSASGQTTAWSNWTDSFNPALPTPVTTPTVTNHDVVLIPAGSRSGGVIETAIDSDNPRSQVLARIPAGPYAGATLLANGVQIAGDGVSINFNRMEWNGDVWNVDVWAAMPDTLQSSVATSVNNRYLTRIVLPALAGGVGLGGQLYASANTQILSNGYNNIEGRVGMPDSKAVAGTIIGGAAQQAGQVIASDAQRLPVKQVLVERGQTVALLFMSAVKSGDSITRASADRAGSQRIQPAIPIP